MSDYIPPTAIPVHDEPPRPAVKRRVHRPKVAKRKWTRRTAAPVAEPASQAFEPERNARPEAAREEALPHEQLTRVSREDRDVNRFAIPSHRIKPGWDVEWKTMRVLNEPVSNSNIMDAHHAGWRAEKARDWPELCPPGTPPDSGIEQDGLKLFGRPKQFTMQARQEDYNAATRQLADRARSAQEGRTSDGEGLADMRGVQSVPMGLSIEGEVGATVPVRR